MTERPCVLPLDATVMDAARLMRATGVGGVLVTSRGRLCGLVTDRDLVVRALADDRDGAVTPLAEVCSGDVVTVRPQDDTGTALGLMHRHDVRRLPVVDAAHHPVGLVTLADVTPDSTPDGAGSG